MTWKRTAPDRAVAEESNKTTVTSKLEGESKTVMVIESNTKLQDALRERLKKAGYRVLIFRDPKRALHRLETREDFDSKVADCVIFGCGELSTQNLEAFNFFADNEEFSRIGGILLTDETQGHFKSIAKLAPHRVVVDMPLKLRELRAALVKVITTAESLDG